jgi:hypothetical protein
MKAVIRFTELEEARALPILLRHSPGSVLSDRTYVVERSVLEALREARGCLSSSDAAAQLAID